jgi:hypothetical protein
VCAFLECETLGSSLLIPREVIAVCVMCTWNCCSCFAFQHRSQKLNMKMDVFTLVVKLSKISNALISLISSLVNKDQLTR